MCESRNWTRLFARESFSDSVVITATRSDGIIFEELLQFETAKLHNIKPKEIIIRSLLKLESYRNCKCTQTDFCELHLDKGIR